MDIDRATTKMGEYMLKGWVLTDKTCSTVNCPVPLMRSPNGQTPVVHFCTRCHGGPEGLLHAYSSAVGLTSNRYRCTERSRQHNIGLDLDCVCVSHLARFDAAH